MLPMTLHSNSPELALSVGEKSDFKIDIVLPAIKLSIVWSENDTNFVLFLTEGYMTFFVDSVNVLEVSGNADRNTLDKSHSRLSLSMFLEWVLFDQSYLPLGGSSSFAELIASESSPPISFTLRERLVDIEWDFNHLKRSNLSYSTPSGNGQIQYREYLKILCTTVDTLVAGIERRAKALALGSQWHKWWSGYTTEANSFHDFVQKWSD